MWPSLFQGKWTHLLLIWNRSGGLPGGSSVEFPFVSTPKDWGCRSVGSSRIRRVLSSQASRRWKRACWGRTLSRTRRLSRDRNWQLRQADWVRNWSYGSWGLLILESWSQRSDKFRFGFLSSGCSNQSSKIEGRDSSLLSGLDQGMGIVRESVIV